MLGHKLWEHLSLRYQDTYATIRMKKEDYRLMTTPGINRIIEGIDVTDIQLLAGVLKAIRPEFIVNCIGVTKRREDSHDPIPSIILNALFPHRLVQLAAQIGAKVIHFSTDCVFDGKAGHYSDEDPADATDLYGRTKALGEISGRCVLTLRSSFIGRELHEGTELLDWFLSQKGVVKGFKNAIYSGLTTIELSRVVEKILNDYPDAEGLYNVSSEPISKFDLLKLIGRKMHPGVEVLPDESFHCDRSLDSTRFRNRFDYMPPTWESMVDELKNER